MLQSHWCEINSKSVFTIKSKRGHFPPVYGKTRIKHGLWLDLKGNNKWVTITVDAKYRNNKLKQITYARQISHNEEGMLTGHYLAVCGGFFLTTRSLSLQWCFRAWWIFMPPIWNLTICLKDSGTEREKGENSEMLFFMLSIIKAILPHTCEKPAVNRSNAWESGVNQNKFCHNLTICSYSESVTHSLSLWFIV